ncbi:hypothetical protein NOR53_2810 [gamma proteobacterium NOR5-3]|nr:hypothetical protein NOR53_2810 [gamma proteobacterium NOR5-3]
MDHARRKFVETSRAGSDGKKKGKAKGRAAKADVALGFTHYDWGRPLSFTTEHMHDDC